jgi:phytoene dehydrogenase-like protein
VPGGLLTMIHNLRDFIESKGGALHTKEGVTSINTGDHGYVVETKKGNRYTAPVVISNILVWNMSELTQGDIRTWFQKQSERFDHAWGALTMGVATTNTYDEKLPLHHQLHLYDDEVVPYTNSGSVFVSMSHQKDDKRATDGHRTLNISTHAEPERWFSMSEDEYARAKESVKRYLLNTLRKQLPGFSDATMIQADLATPVTWQNWVYRKKGRVGGIPQSMARSLLDWTPPQTPFKGLYLVGDTTYPGQGIPGVTLSGINVYSRIKTYL